MIPYVARDSRAKFKDIFWPDCWMTELYALPHFVYFIVKDFNLTSS